jgi:hypothetical protein
MVTPSRSGLGTQTAEMASKESRRAYCKLSQEGFSFIEQEDTLPIIIKR